MASVASAQQPNRAAQVNTQAREFAAALADYDTGRLADATAILEAMQRTAKSSFDVHELLGMSYGAQGQDAKAVAELQRAVELKQGSVSARTNLATALVRVGEFSQAEEQARRARATPPETTAQIEFLRSSICERIMQRRRSHSSR